MCGRFVDAHSTGDLADLLCAERIETEVSRPAYNIAPTQKVRLVADSVDADTGEVVRRLTDARWGLIPSWAKDPTVGTKMINARSETVTSKPSFRAAATKRRGIMPASGYYEWMKTPAGKQPIYLHLADEGQPLWFAALYEWWLPPEAAEGDETAWMLSSTIITRAASDALGHIHERTPVCVPDTMIDRWLDPAITDKHEVEALLAAIPDPTLAVRTVGRAVGNVRSQGPQLIEPASEV